MIKKLTEYQQKNVDGIMVGLSGGKNVVPTFQRNYEWETIRIVNFLNSMINKEPFGYIVIWWSTNNKDLNDSRNYILNKYKDSVHNGNEIEYLIDGQQRLTTCFILKNWYLMHKDFLNWKDQKKYCEEYKQIKNIYNKFKDIYFNIDSQKFEIIKRQENLSNHIQLHLLSEYKKSKKIINELPDKIKSKWQDKEILENKIEESIDNFKSIFDVSIGCVNLKNYDLCDVIEIFQNMNTKGKSLSMFDLLHSKWYENNVNLDVEFKQLINQELSGEWNNLSKDVFVDVIYLILNKEKPIIKNKEKLELNLNVFIKDKNEKSLNDCINNAINSIKRATQLLSEYKFNISNIPSQIIIKWLSYFCYKRDNKIINAKDRAFILYYISLISIEQRYSSSTSTKLEKDIYIMDLLIKNDSSALIKEFKHNDFSIQGEDFYDEKYGSQSMKTKFIIWILLKNAKDPFTEVEVTNIDFKQHNQHHVFPKNIKDKSIFGETYSSDCILNILPLSGETNKKISNNKPSVYLNKFTNDKNRINEILRNCGILTEYLRNDDFESMIKHRNNWLINKLNEEVEKWKNDSILDKIN